MLSARVREFATATVAVVAILAIFLAPRWMIEAVMALMAAGVMYWAATCSPERLSLPNGLPRPFLFGLLIAGIAMHLSVVRFLTDHSVEMLGITTSLILLTAALGIGLLRVFWRSGAQPRQPD